MDMDLGRFLGLPVEDVARLVRASGPKVCAFPINGTRRWFLLEAGGQADYLGVVSRRHVELYRMIFAHGVDTLLAPMFGPDLIERGPEYMDVAIDGLTRLATHPDFLNFYQEYEVRVRFYGDYRRLLAGTPHAPMIDLFDRIADQTKDHRRCRLFFGVFANNANQTTADLAIRYFAEHGRVPDENQLIELYYGEPVGPANLFIGFDKFSAFDMPLIPTDSTDLYFTVSPSLYLTERQWRAILFDHVYSRRLPEPDYEELSGEAVAEMKEFYRSHAEDVFGLGVLRHGIWYPTLGTGGPTEAA